MASLISCLISCPRTGAQQFTDAESDVYSLDAGDIMDGTGVEHVYHGYRAALGESIPEIRPPHRDELGNWGSATNGVQLSLRFRRSEFANGEPIVAVVILRNLTSVYRELSITNAPGYRLGILFSVSRGGSEPLKIRAEERERFEIDTNAPSYTDPLGSLQPFKGLMNFGLRARSERLVTVDLRELFDLSQNGEYSILARMPVFNPKNQFAECEVASGSTTLRVVDKLSTSGEAERKAWEQNLQELRQRAEQKLRKSLPD